MHLENEFDDGSGMNFLYGLGMTAPARVYNRNVTVFSLAWVITEAQDGQQKMAQDSQRRI